ncbi:thiamine diphosphokinase [Parabacteroides bouchesdurhonensis]|uniref:thiamine diphosphokinase n=1 Tax=Parabacteroides bouchesdurhonensis TaxID=1936995 RepID=UPI000C838180|nr:thiamine diphosphokinase [Parabacteroides bouchesdurhonensis]
MKMLYDCIIVANGSFPSAQLPLDYLHNAPVVIACDGAVQTLHDKGITPSAIIGDMDSIPASLKELYADRIHIVEDQEINDLTKSVYYAHQAGYKRILILGATGLREDHTLGNISLLLEYAPLFEHIEMLSDYGRFIPILRTTTLSSSPKQQVSIFPMYPYGEISTEGLRWPINHRTLTAWWQGTLNEATGDKFTVFLSPETRVIVYMQNQN